MANVKFYFGIQSKYDALTKKDSLALYFIEDTQRLYKGDVLMAVGTDATSMASGLMSAEDKIKLDGVATGAHLNLVPVDDSIVISDVDGGKSIGVQISKVEGNLIAVKDDGLFAAVETLPLESIIGLKDRLDAIEQAAVGGVHYRGNVPTVDDLPIDAAQGDLYEVLEDNSEWCFNGDAWFEYGNTSGFTPIAGDGIEIVDGTFSIKIAEESHGLVAVDGALALVLATKDNDGAMSKEDKAFIASIPEIYMSKKYEIADTPAGTLVKMNENEIRIMCPESSEWALQNVGAGGDANTHYVTLKTYVPNDNIVGYIEHLGNVVDAEILTDLKTDEYGRRYQPTWLGVAKYDKTTDSWTYYGANSTEDHYIGWDYQIDWYDANGVVVSSDSIRINLSNEGCHYSIEPYYVGNMMGEVRTMIEDVQGSYSWGEL